MNFRLTFALLLVLIVAVGLFIFEQRRPTVAKVEDTMMVISPAPSDLVSLSLARDGETQLAFEQMGHKWSLTAPVKAAAGYQVDTAASTLKNLTYREKFTPEATGPHSLEDTGLASPHYAIQFADDKSHAFKLLLGKRTGVTGIYARLDGDASKTIFVLGTNPLDQLDKDPSDFRSSDLVDVETEKVTGLTVAHPDQKVELVKSDGGKGKWIIQSPIPTRANAAAVDKVVNQFKDLKVAANGFVPVTRDMPASGLAAPRLSISVAIASDVQAFTVAPRGTSASQPATVPAGPITHTLTVDFGNPSDITKKNVYASLGGTNEAVLVSTESFNELNKALKDLRDPAITPAPVADATHITVSSATSKDTLDLDRKDNTWTFWTTTSPSPVVGLLLPAESSTANDFLNALRDLRANKFVDGPGDLKAIGLDPPQQTITLQLPGQSQQEVILIGKPQTVEPLTPVQRQGENTVYLVQTPDLAKLSPTLMDLRSRTLGDWKPTDIVDITLAGSGVKFPAKLARSGATWKIDVAGKTWDVPDTKMTTLLADLNPLKAEKWVETTPFATTDQSAAVEITLNVIDTPAASQPGTQPSSQPAAAGMGPMLPKTHHITLVHPKDTVWQGLTDSVSPPWVFQPTAAFVSDVTTVDYRPPAATQPSTQAGTQAGTQPATAAATTTAP